jgi:hypothetical protein
MEVFISRPRDSKVKKTGIHSNANIHVFQKPIRVCNNNPTKVVAVSKTFCFKRIPASASVLEEKPSDDYL